MIEGNSERAKHAFGHVAATRMPRIGLSPMTPKRDQHAEGDVVELRERHDPVDGRQETVVLHEENVRLPGEPGSGGDSDRLLLLRVLIAIAVAALLIVGFAVFAAWARGGYFIAFDENGEAIIYGGRSGGVLWFEPTAETEGGPTADQLTDEAVVIIEDEPRFDSRDDAADFLRGSAAPTTTTTTSTTSTTTTTVAPTTSSAPPTTSGP